MKQIEIVSGFSELKGLLIRTYKIERSSELIKLYFTLQDQQLYMHDYDDHKKAVLLAKDIDFKDISDQLAFKAQRLVAEAIDNPNPAEFLNMEFKLSGFFRP